MHRHPFDPVSFIAGVVFVGLGVASLAGADLDPNGLRWLIPVVLMSLGVALLLPLLRGPDDRGSAGMDG